jgi:hypothetical protein
MEAEFQHKIHIILRLSIAFLGTFHQWKSRIRRGAAWLFKRTTLNYSPITKNLTVIYEVYVDSEI